MIKTLRTNVRKISSKGTSLGMAESHHSQGYCQVGEMEVIFPKGYILGSLDKSQSISIQAQSTS